MFSWLEGDEWLRWNDERILIKMRMKIGMHVVSIEFVLLYVWVCCVKCGMKLDSIKGINYS